MNNEITLANTKSIPAAVDRVTAKLPELVEQTKIFDRTNSQSMLTMMTLTMLNGQSPMRMLRQILAEVENRRMALSESQIHHAELVSEIEYIETEDPSPIRDAKLRSKRNNLAFMESKISGAIKDIAILSDAYDAIKKKNNLESWNEVDFESTEKKHHVRRGFELLYRNLLHFGRISEATVEYLQQYGIHPQIALAEVTGYITHTEKRITNGERMTSADLELFLDQMSEKYVKCADEASERIFGKSDISNPDYMLKLTNQK